MNVYLKFFLNDLKRVLNCAKNKRYLNHFFVLSSINSLKWFGNVLLKKCRKSINFIVQLNLNLWKTIWIDNMIKTKRRNLVQKNLKYTLGSFYFVGNKFLDCQLFNDMGCYFIISLVCTLQKDLEFLGSTNTCLRITHRIVTEF